MVATVIIGVLFGTLFIWAFNKSKKDLKENKCAGCSGNCSSGQCDISDIKLQK